MVRRQPLRPASPRPGPWAWDAPRRARAAEPRGREGAAEPGPRGSERRRPGRLGPDTRRRAGLRPAAAASPMPDGGNLKPPGPARASGLCLAWGGRGGGGRIRVRRQLGRPRRLALRWPRPVIYTRTAPFVPSEKVPSERAARQRTRPGSARAARGPSGPSSRAGRLDVGCALGPCPARARASSRSAGVGAAPPWRLRHPEQEQGAGAGGLQPPRRRARGALTVPGTPRAQLHAGVAALASAMSRHPPAPLGGGPVAAARRCRTAESRRRGRKGVWPERGTDPSPSASRAVPRGPDPVRVSNDPGRRPSAAAQPLHRR